MNAQNQCTVKKPTEFLINETDNAGEKVIKIYFKSRELDKRAGYIYQKEVPYNTIRAAGNNNQMYPAPLTQLICLEHRRFRPLVRGGKGQIF